MAIVLNFLLFAISTVSVQAEESAPFRIPGIIEGSGKHFEITDSEYLNIALNSSEDITAKIESAPEMIVIEVKSSSSVDSANLIFSGFASGITYHKYEDNYHNYAPLIADENGSFSFTQDVSQNHIIFIQPRKSTKFIKDDATGGDCTNIGSWNASSKTCTLTQDLNETVQIDNDNIILDGAGHKISGNNTGNGIYVIGDSVIVKNISVSNFYYGVYFYYSDDSEINNSILENNNFGIDLVYSNRNKISNNTIKSNAFYGLGLYYSGGNTCLENIAGPNNGYGISEEYKGGNVYENNIASNNKNTGIRLAQGESSALRGNTANSNAYYGIQIDRTAPFTMKNNSMSDNGRTNLEIFNSITPLNDIDKSNKESGKSIYYLENIENEIFDGTNDMASFYCFECKNINLKNLSLPDGARIFFWRANDSIIENIVSLKKSIGVYLLYSWRNIIRNSDLWDIYVNGGSNKIYSNNFSTNFITSSSSSTSNLFNFDLPVGGNYWKRNEAACIDDNNDGFCDYPYKFSKYGTDYYPRSKPFDYDLVPPAPSGNSNVLFLPGIKASELYKNDSGDEDQLWPPNYFGNDVEELMLDENGKSIENVYTKDVLKSTLTGNIYASFVDDLENLKTEGKINDYAEFAYDWRQSVEDIAKNGTPYQNIVKSLTTEIQNLAENSKSKKVTIVAHSNGGLVAKAAMLELEKIGLAGKVDKIIFVATPQMGTPSAIFSMLYGYEESLAWGTLMSQSEARSLAENMPGAYGLLPAEEYFERIENPFITFSSENTRYKNFKDAYGDSIGSFGEFIDFLTGEGDGREKPNANDVESENILRENLLDEAIETQERLNIWTPPENIEVIEIAGWGLDTISGVDYTEKEKTKCYDYPGFKIPSCAGTGEYEPVYDPKFTVDGDAVVVAPSALMLTEAENVKKYWMDLYEYNDNNIPDRKHKDILEIDNARQFISNILTNSDATPLPEYIKTSRPDDYANAKPRLRMALYSPLDIHLYDDQNNHTGPKKIIDENGNEQIIFEENIPNSYYYQFGERKYVGVPSGENIRMVMNGYDSGTYTLKMEEVEETATGEEIISHTGFKNLPVSSETNVSLNIPETGLDNLSDLETDFDGDGENDYVVAPVSNGEATLPDIIPPATEIKLSGTEGNNSWFASDVSVALSAEDNMGGLGIDAISYSLDSGALWQNYSEPINISNEGIINFQYFATDKKGNKEEIKTEIIKIDKTAPEAKWIFNQAEQKLDIFGVDNLSQNISVETEEQEIKQKSEIKKGALSWIFDIIKKSEKRKNVSVILTDESGHKTEIVFEKKENNNHRVDVFPRSVSYDGVKTAFSKSLLQYKWLLDWRRKKYILFGSHIATESELLESHYFPKRNETWIMEKPRELGDDDNNDDAEKRPVWKKLPGMIIPYMQTKQGKIEIGY